MSDVPPPQKKIFFFRCLLCVSEHSECFLKPVKKLGMGWRPTHPIGNNSQIWLFFFFKASLIIQVFGWVGLGHIRTKKHLKLPFLAQNNLSANGQHFFCATLYNSVFLLKKKEIKNMHFSGQYWVGKRAKKSQFFFKRGKGAPKKFSF